MVRGWGGEEIARFRWPEPSELIPDWVPKEHRNRYTVEVPTKSLERLAVTNSGTRVAVALGSGVLVATAGRDGWRLVLPRHDEPGEWVLEELAKGEEIGFHGDMVHVALSADGTFLACGAQDEGHHLFSVDAAGEPKHWATLGHASEYPDDACFSEDGAYVALNSCHFYNGATIVARVAEVAGLTTEPYDEDTRTPVINDYLRVYASTWLPGEALGGGAGVFALAGAGVLTLVGIDGKVRSELMFGSSASGIDYCPKTQTLVLGSYSGFLHFLRPGEDDPSAIGWHASREVKRWCFLKDLPPLQW